MSKEKVKGTVRWFSNDRGYGFITLDDDIDKTEYFVHYSSIEMDNYKTLKPKQPVLCVLKKEDKGLQATEVELI